MTPVPHRQPATDADSPSLREAELGKAYTLLHLALEAGRSVAWDWNVKTGRDSWFGDLQTVFGIASTSYVGHVEDFRRRVYAQDRELVWRAVKHAMENRVTYLAEFRVVHPDGSLRWLAAQGRFYYSSGGEPERMLGIGVDITERKSAEETLRRQDLELAEAQRLAGVGTWRWNAEDDSVRWSDELYRVIGRDPRLPAINLWENSRLFTLESGERLRHAVRNTLRSAEPFELDLEMTPPDGSARWVTARGETQHDSEGRISGLRGTLQDITERRRSEQALRESEERLRLAAQAGRMYAFEWDPQSDVVVRSAEFTHLLGAPSESPTTTRAEILRMVHPDDLEKFLAATRACNPENPTYQAQYRRLCPDGSLIWLEKTGHAFFNPDGALQKVVGMVVDITERKRAEEALSAFGRRLIEAQEAERARIARNLHDDVGQRFAVILATLDQLRQHTSAFGESAGSQFDDLRKQIVEVSRGVNSLSHELHSASLRHLGMARAMRDLCREISEKQKVEITFSSENVPDAIPQESALCLFRILQEALRNAVKHSQTRDFTVDVRGTPNAILLQVRDSGVGFEPEQATNGHGLGLVSMQERLKLVNGELTVDSRPGCGATIRARVPNPAGKI
jgi:PAS domain S-box-containing protein